MRGASLSEAVIKVSRRHNYNNPETATDSPLSAAATQRPSSDSDVDYDCQQK